MLTGAARARPGYADVFAVGDSSHESEPVLP